VRLKTGTQRERNRCAQLAADASGFYAVLAEKAKAAGDEPHWRLCLARQWCAEELAMEIRNGKRPERKANP
jgi:hypothetical protein